MGCPRCRVTILTQARDGHHRSRAIFRNAAPAARQPHPTDRGSRAPPAGPHPAGVSRRALLLQDRIIFPGTATQGTPESRVDPPPGTELLRLTAPQARTSSPSSVRRSCRTDGPIPIPASRPALLYFYGNAMCLAYSEPEFERFRRLGLNVLIPDFLGYGQERRQGLRDRLPRDGRDRVSGTSARGFPASRIIAGGWSLGGAVAIDLASRQRGRRAHRLQLVHQHPRHGATASCPFPCLASSSLTSSTA